MSLIFFISLIGAIILILREDRVMRVRFFKLFCGLTIFLLIFYAIIDPENFGIENIIGILFIAVLLGLLFSFIQKWSAKKK